MTSHIFDIEVRAFDRASGVRKNFNPKLVLGGVTWSYVERGGAEMATIPIAVPFEQIPGNWPPAAGTEDPTALVAVSIVATLPPPLLIST